MSSPVRATTKLLARSNSSFLGSLKSIVTAPLSWFGGEQQDYEEDASGKRRRVAPVAQVPAMEQDSEPSPAKRMRIGSPDRSMQSSQSGYLDPPVAAFQPAATPAISPVKNHVNRLNINASRRTPDNARNSRFHSPSRHPPRPMSVDRARPQGAQPIAHLSYTQDQDISMEPAPTSYFTATLNRDHSMPPLPRPPFKMRSSMTPQPQAPRDKSEPPAIASLRSNPVFVRPPSQSPQAPRKLSAPAPTTTLGSLYESNRSVSVLTGSSSVSLLTLAQSYSPARQHGSILFGPQNPSQEAGMFTLSLYHVVILISVIRSSIYESHREAHQHFGPLQDSHSPQPPS
jgi:nucleoporin NUP1